MRIIKHENLYFTEDGKNVTDTIEEIIAERLAEVKEQNE